MKFLLINAQRDFLYRGLKKDTLALPQYPPLGLLYIARSLEDEGHSIELIEYFGEKDPDTEIKTQLKNIDAIGICVASYPFKYAKDIAKMIKETEPSIPIIIGGPHCIFHPKKSLIDIPNADISVEGDGEQTIKDIADALMGKKQLSEIPGVHYRKNKTIKKGKQPVFFTNLDEIAFPSHHLITKYEYGKFNNSFLFKRKVGSISTTRGCPFKCRFCPRNKYYSTFRQRSAENVLEELQDLEKIYRTIVIIDENFLTDVKRAHKIMNGLIEQKSTLDLIIHGTRVDTANRKLYQKMKKAGVKFISYGIESGNQDVLDFYDKKITLDEIKNAVELANETGIQTMGQMILGAPIETEEHIKQTIKFACSLPLDYALFYPLSYLYGSDLWIEAVKSGKIHENDGYVVLSDSDRKLGNFTKEELRKICNGTYHKFYLRPSYILRQLLKVFKRRDFNSFKIFTNYLQK